MMMGIRTGADRPSVAGYGGVRGIDVERDRVCFAQDLVVMFFGAGSKVGFRRELRVRGQARVRLAPDCAGHGHDTTRPILPFLFLTTKLSFSLFEEEEEGMAGKERFLI